MQATVHTSLTYNSPKARVRVFNDTEEDPKLYGRKNFYLVLSQMDHIVAVECWLLRKDRMKNGKLNMVALQKSVLGQIKLRHLYNGTIDQVREATMWPWNQ